MGGPGKSSQWAGAASTKSADSGEFAQEFAARNRSLPVPGPGWPKLPCPVTAAEIALPGSRLVVLLPSSEARQHVMRNSRTFRFCCRHVATTMSCYDIGELAEAMDFGRTAPLPSGPTRGGWPSAWCAGVGQPLEQASMVFRTSAPVYGPLERSLWPCLAGQ